MNASSTPSSATATRRAWMAVLAHTPCAELEAALSDALAGAPEPAFDWLRPPQTGLAMVRGRIGGTGDAFNLGEATVTRATLRLRASSADRTEGADANQPGPVGVACHLGRDKRRAELAALADALLQLPTRHDQLHDRLIEPLAARLAARRDARRADAASTRVEFFTMVRGDA
ncbi:Alpha-D-ribose 1-methylphosphonate 5-triphosphate synthase subunit PhnG [Paraburkholderia hiiakae]|uniref:Alpha-D-ribose 1-methylphosphonate 5-triphosphate synthase subunit PhnG n=1 Tax=Paraburkholderia hiiakae TaxID=1081782 RepID=A0ABM8NSL1_9BURK|nr:phosphonate C-P lyase system protein PhnG [Paraburkholderia hiiakae]CAD6541167.1 Alpha-D-ribose 1-methylphosphonate 5-triphosphate synthase subunit PhnG [Paraburkholderia hiiakae]